MKSKYTIDGTRIHSLETFYDEISRVLIPNQRWGRNLDAFNDILRGGFGTSEGFTLTWSNAAESRARLGYQETARQLELRLAQCHPDNRGQLSQEIADAHAGIGPTVFDWLVGIIRNHGPGGDEAEDGIRLVLD
ncbi:RNAse (barnase) inhibitor barstar [Aminobacter lissarensis]|uniref:RNAse (Barnase) inhibitor barstar n=1 Tax=Aminobacter carboxidus TaxID=376165 RepID=A0A8E1WL06_9HYPH|nr:barstar family protein [Aminobacter lissarensis]MBB6469301.1 RNAse (barnase) inhibitor barstar [Aminobacter lissarensis]